MDTRHLIAALCMTTSACVLAASEADLEAAFDPYKGGFPTHQGLVPGMVINKANLAQFRDVVNPGLQKAVSEGWYEITVGKTTNFDAHSRYIAETRKNLNKARLGPKLGEIEGYAGGLPFPGDPSIDDARAGEKMAWNFKYNYGAGDGSQYAPFYYLFRNMHDGKTERVIKFGYYVQKHKYRVSQSPLGEITPNPSGLFRSFYIRVSDPPDIRNTQLLIQRYQDDTKRDDAYLYLGFQRRVRRLATGQTADPFLGTDLMIEDFEGYNARVSDMNWKYKGVVNVLMPMYHHNALKLSTEFRDDDGYQYVATTGKGGCFVNITWQLRKAYVVEGTPVAEGHPVGKRVFYVDAQTSTIPQTLIYDRKGELWKVWTIGISHPDHHLPQNKGSGVPLFDSFSMVDVQSGHCTVGLIRGQVEQPDNNLFNVQQMRGGTN